ncbi:MAG TPA: hypothetical protein VFW89_03245 [Gemmatimonadaceae bacterium]|nr:hypothetical protein [Gemmatimonadaceae bacterium]
MDLIVEHSGHHYWWLATEDARDFRPAAAATPYTCFLWDTSGNWSAPVRTALANALLDSGCRYLVCGGETCERWHNDVDELLAARSAFPATELPFVGTTWHAGESAEKVAEFFVLHARVPDGDIREHLVLQLGLDWDVQNDLMIWTRAWVEHPYGVDAPDRAGE